MPSAKRRLGQHFLSDPRILERIADALAAGPGDTVLEIGPGPGGLTAALAARAGRVIAIEKDRELVPALRERFPGVSIVEGDALEVDWHALVRAWGGTEARPTIEGQPSIEGRPTIEGSAAPGIGAAAETGSYLVAGNIPYNITSPLIDKALVPPRPARIVFLVQKEVADRVTARPGTAAYGALSVGVQAVARAERLFTVPAGAFHPKPKVDSAVLRLTPVEHPLVPDAGRESFRRLVVGLFGFRRKQLGRGLRELTGWAPDRVSATLREVGVDETARPEVLSPAQFATLHGVLVDAGWPQR